MSVFRIFGTATLNPIFYKLGLLGSKLSITVFLVLVLLSFFVMQRCLSLISCCQIATYVNIFEKLLLHSSQKIASCLQEANE